MRSDLETWFASLIAAQARRMAKARRAKRSASKNIDEITVLTIREHTRTVQHFDVRMPDIVKDQSDRA